MAKMILVANWKNNPASLAEARDILKGYAKKKDLYKKLSFFIAPPATYYESVSEKAKLFSQLAVQDISSLSKGTYTGVITSEIAKSFGARLAIIGHSERRALGESNKDVAEKVKVALRAGITPLVCVGEESRDTEGEHFEVLRTQIKESLNGLTKQSVSSVVLAYEPVWAVGEKAVGFLKAEDLAQTVIFIKKVLSDLFGRSATDKIAVLYGGSVDANNAGVLAREGGVRGLLVGRASLNPKSLEAVALSLTQK